jgi:hypothetical protein
MECFEVTAMSNRVRVCDWHTTPLCAVFQSPSRLKLAVEHGFNLQPNEHNNYDFHRTAGFYADVQTLSLAAELGMTFNLDTIKAAAASGHVDAFNYVLKGQQSALTSRSCVECQAIRSGNIDMLKCLTQNGFVFSRDSCGLAATAGQLPALQYILSTYSCRCHDVAYNVKCKVCSWLAHSSLSSAARSGNIEMVQWLEQQQGVQSDQDAITSAASRGRTNVCEYLHSQQYQWSSAATDAAARGGHTDTLVWLHEHGCPWDTTSIHIAAARSGSVAAMQYLLQQGVVTRTAQLTKMLQIVGAHSKLETAQWLRQQGAEWPDVLSWGERPDY